MARSKAPSKGASIGSSTGAGAGPGLGPQPQQALPPVPGTGLAGSAVAPVHGRRFIKQYLVTESEFGTIAYFNTASTTCFSVAAFVVSWPVGRVIDWINSGLLSEKAPEPFYWILAGVSLVAFCLGFYFGKRQGSIYNLIKSETKHEEVQY